MYLTHFGLQQLPFSITPDPDFFFVGNKRGEILEALIYSVVHGDGIIKVTGEVGCGKTMLCRMLERRLPSHIEVIYLVNPTLNHDQVIFTIAGELDLPIQGKRVDEVIRLLHSALITKHAAGKQVVLLIEEAQAMSMQTLEEIRLFSNLETARYKLLQIVLFGQPELDDHLNVPSMRQLKERITNSFKLPPLTATTIPDYLMFRLRAAGYHGSDLFDEAAIKLINRVSQGIVRRISILADKSLLAAFADNAHSVGEAHVLAAIEDSEFSNTTAGAMRSPRRLVTAAIAVLLVGAAIWFAWLNHGPSQVQLGATKKAPATPVASKSTAAAPFVLVAEKAVTATISTSAAAAASAPTSTPLISSNVVSPVSTAPTAATSNLPAPVNTLAVVKPPVTAPTPKVEASALSPNSTNAAATSHRLMCSSAYASCRPAATSANPSAPEPPMRRTAPASVTRPHRARKSPIGRRADQPISTVARFIAAVSAACMGTPFNVAPPPCRAAKVSPKAGATMTPAKGWSPSSNPSETQNRFAPRM